MEKEIKDLEEVVEIIQERLAELKEIGKAETPKRWRAEEGNTYYYLTQGLMDSHIERYDSVDDRNYIVGNYFKTEEQARKKLEHLKIEQQLKDIALRLNNGVEIDWEDIHQKKYLLFYNSYEEEVENDYFFIEKYQGIIYCLDQNFKDIAIAEIGEDRLKNYLKEC